MPRVWLVPGVLAVLLGLALSASSATQRDDAFGESRNHPAIDYTNGAVADAVAALNDLLAAGRERLAWDPATGFLRAALDALKLPFQSQVLVFSKTSFQADLVELKRPRAIYFNDEIAIGYVRGAAVLEIAAMDPRQGVIFYELRQEPSDQPRFVRKESCLACHLSWDTRAVPGPLVQTVFPRQDERDYANGFVVDHRVPIAERWGGWWVTGVEVPGRHMGNQPLIQPTPVNRSVIPTLTSVQGHADLDDLPAPYSDVVALMMLEHQAHLTNLITRAGWEARVAEAAGGRMLTPRVRQAVEELADYLLFVDEAPLPSPVKGSAGYAEWFERQGPRDSKGRSLRQLDLQTRLMRYPLSYMIYSTGFDGLPRPVKHATYERLIEILSGKVTDPKYAHLTPAVRADVLAILRETKPDVSGATGGR